MPSIYLFLDSYLNPCLPKSCWGILLKIKYADIYQACLPIDYGIISLRNANPQFKHPELIDCDKLASNSLLR